MFQQDVVAKVTVLGRRKLESVPEQYGADLSVEESEGRLVQHVEGGQKQDQKLLKLQKHMIFKISTHMLHALC